MCTTTVNRSDHGCKSFDNYGSTDLAFTRRVIWLLPVESTDLLARLRRVSQHVIPVQARTAGYTSSSINLGALHANDRCFLNLRTHSYPRRRAKGTRISPSPLQRDKFRRRPTLPGSFPPSTIGAGSLNFRVRNGNGCDPAAMVTGNL